jgi:thymidylate synthase ThyX
MKWLGFNAYINNDITRELLDKSQLSNLEIKYESICNMAYDYYKSAINALKEKETNGVISNEEYKRAREIMRCQLPVSGMTERTTIMNLRSFANYQKQRNSSYAQPEIKKVAELMLEEVKRVNVCPIAIKTLQEIGWRC